MLLDGHYLQQVYAGEMMRLPFSDINLMGYDNQSGKYKSVWLDSMSTGIFYFTGPASAEGKTITQECSYDNPVKGPSLWRTVSRIKDDNTVDFRYSSHPRGKGKRR